MLILLFVLLIIGFIISYVVSQRNILSAWVLAHLMYLLSTTLLLFNQDMLKGDIMIDTVLVIIWSIACIGAGELFVRGVFFKNRKTCYYPSLEELSPICISRKMFLVSLILILVAGLYDFYCFNIIGSHLGGADFASKYALIRLSVVRESNGIEQELPSVPLGRPMAYLEFLVRILAYFYIYVFLYNKNFKVRDPYRANWKYLLPVISYLPVCFFTTSRSVFINLIETFGIIEFIMIKQSGRKWASSSSNFQIARRGIVLLVVFIIIFSFVGTFKDSDVTEDVAGTAISYAGAGIYGLDEYLRGNFATDSEYIGQRTFSNLFVILNKFGFNFKLPKYHNEPFVWGKYGEVSNIASSPFYFMIDFPLIVVSFIYFILGAIYSIFINSIKFGKFKVKDFDGYVITALLYYSVFMISITESFHSNIGSVFVYSIICVYIIKYIFITKPRQHRLK